MRTTTTGYQTPEEAKRRVADLDREMGRTLVLVEKAAAAGRLSQQDRNNWRATMRQWDAFSADVAARSSWAMFDYADVEANCRAYEAKQNAIRAKLAAGGVPVDPGLNVPAYEPKSEWGGIASGALAVLGIFAVGYLISNVRGRR